MGRKAQVPKYGARENWHIRIQPRCVSGVEISIENDFKVSIEESEKQIPLVRIPP